MIIAVGRDNGAGWGVDRETAQRHLEDAFGGEGPMFYIEVDDKYFVAPEVPTLKLGD